MQASQLGASGTSGGGGGVALTGPGLDPNLLLPPLASSKIYIEDADRTL